MQLSPREVQLPVFDSAYGPQPALDVPYSPFIKRLDQWGQLHDCSILSVRPTGGFPNGNVSLEPAADSTARRARSVPSIADGVHGPRLAHDPA
jgi:hypothetical protein